MPFHVILTYWAMAICTGAAVVVLTVRSQPSGLDGNTTNVLSKPSIFCAAQLICLFAWRWPSIVYPAELNPDESQAIAQAMKFMADPVPWRSVDSTTWGPLNSYALVPPAWFGFDFGYGSARVMGVLCIWASLVSAYFAIRAVGDDMVARLTVTPMMFFFTSATSGNYVHYSSELVSIALISAGLQFACTAIWGTMSSRKLFICGLFLGAVPFAKLQAGPLAVALFVAIVLVAVYKTRKQRLLLRVVGPMALGGLFVPSCMFSLIFITGQSRHFWNSYIMLGNLYGSRMLKLSDAVRFAFGSHEFVYFFFGGLALIGVIVLYHWLQSRETFRIDGCFAFLVVVFALATALVVVKPARQSLHYFLFAIHPTAFCVSVFLIPFCATIANQRQPSKSLIHGREKAISVLCVLLIWLYALGVDRTFDALRHPYLKIIKIQDTPHRELAVKKIKSLKLSNNRLAVWGWAAEYYVYTGMTPATRDATTAMITQGRTIVRVSPKRRRYYQSRFLADLKSSMPAVFIDAVSPEAFEFQNRATEGHEQFPELKEFVARNYELELETSPETQDGVRVYVLKQ